jgi:C4-dicarboxylate transporter, DctM subunit
VILAVIVASVALLVFAAPVWVFLGLPAALGTLSIGVPGAAIAARAIDAVSSDTLISIPMFLLVGNVLISSRAMTDLIGFFDSLVGHYKGGMVLVIVTVAMFFGGISGSTTSEASIMALALTGPMLATGYPARFTAGLIASTATVAILIPPSIPMILYSSITGTSVAKLFIAGLVPGIACALMLGLLGIILARYNAYGGSRRPTSNGVRVRKLAVALPIMTVPLFIVIGIYGGLATPSEIGAVAAVASILITQFIYRDLGRARLWKALVSTTRLSAAVMIMNATAQILSWLLTYEQVPQHLTAVLAGANLSPFVFLIAVNVLFLLLGLPLDPPPIMFMTLPILFPLLAVFGIDPVHFAVLMMVNMTIAQISPPAGGALFAMATVAKIPVTDVYRGVLPFIGVLLVALILITYIPAISLFLLP